MAHQIVNAVITTAAVATLGAVAYAVSVTPPETFNAPPTASSTLDTPREDVSPRVVFRDRVVTEEVPVTVTETVEVPVEVTVPDPTAYDRGYADARAEYEISDDYLADWWEDGRDSGESTVWRDAPLPGGLVDPASIMAALETPCEQEDSMNCYWRADVMGNGQGDSFLNVEGHIYPLAHVLTAGAE